jgi:hypothetical protein
MSAPAASPHVDIVADELPTGPAPRTAYVDADELVRPGRRTSGDLGEQAYAPVRVRGGYLVGAQTPRSTGRWYDDALFVPDHGKTRRILRQPWAGAANYFLGRSTVSADGRLVAMLTSGYDPDLVGEIVRPLPGHRGLTWRTDRGEVVQSWSPNDRLVLTAVDAGPFAGGGELPQTATLRIRQAATGTVVGEIRGLVGVDTEFHRSPVWESSDTLLTSAWSAYVPDDDRPRLDGRREIRCTVSSLTCEAVLPEPAPSGYRPTSLWATRPSS